MGISYMKVLFITNVPSPYRVDFFNELGKYCDLTVTFEKRTSDERDVSWQKYKFINFKGIFLKGFSLNTDTAFCFGLKKIIKKGNFDKIICANISSPTSILAMKYMLRKKKPYIIESDGGFAKKGKGFKEKLKTYFISRANACFSTNTVNDEYFYCYGAKKENVFRYPFTSVFKKDIPTEAPNHNDKVSAREELGVSCAKMLLTVGRFVHCKGIDVFLESLKHIDKECSIYIVGGEPTEEYKELVEKNKLINVNFVGFKSSEELSKYYVAADALVFPTRKDVWGLVVNEAMANALPVITTDRCGAGVALVKDNVNGKIVPTENPKALADAINYVLDNNIDNCMGKNSFNIIQEYTIEEMVSRHIELLNVVGE